MQCKTARFFTCEVGKLFWQFYTTCLNILFVGIRLGWTSKTLNLLGWIPTVRHRFVPPPPHHHHQHIFNISNFQYQKGKHSHQSHQFSIVSSLLCMICPLQIDEYLGPDELHGPVKIIFVLLRKVKVYVQFYQAHESKSI